MIKFTHSVFAHAKSGWQNHKKLILWTSGITTLSVVFLAAGVFAYAKVFENKIYPNVHIGGVLVGGLTQNEATEMLQNRYNNMLDNGLSIMVEGRAEQIDLRSSGASDPDLMFDLIDFSPDNVVSDAYKIARKKSDVENILSALWLPISGRSIDPKITILENQIEEEVRVTFEDLEIKSEPTTYAVTQDDDEIEVTIIEGIVGREIDMETFFMRLNQDVNDLELSIVETMIVDTADVIVTAEAESLISDIQQAIEAAPYTLTYYSQAEREYSWLVTADDLENGLMPVKVNNELVVGFNLNDLEKLVTEIRLDVDVAPKNARFQMEGNKVIEFAGSINGVELDAEETFHALAMELGNSEVELAISVTTVEPEITTQNVNDLGITEILGVGVSDFSGSSNSRITNLKHGSAKLNGLLIAPGEVFSLIDALVPITLEDGFVPEMVIIGDEIKPAVGGGLCQIGTTTFRATMMAGLEVVERRNHSLVVSYYNDARNGNPGTDATIFEPSPDYKLRNTTDNYVLLTTEIDVPNRQLYYTFW
ncbi:MAG: VanW family protein, partial [Patescibacteria group bacterium]